MLCSTCEVVTSRYSDTCASLYKIVITYCTRAIYMTVALITTSLTKSKCVVWVTCESVNTTFTGGQVPSQRTKFGSSTRFLIHSRFLPRENWADETFFAV